MVGKACQAGGVGTSLWETAGRQASKQCHRQRFLFTQANKWYQNSAEQEGSGERKEVCCRVHCCISNLRKVAGLSAGGMGDVS